MPSSSWVLPSNTIMPFIDEETASALEMEGLLSPAVENKRQLSTKIFALSCGSLPPSKYHRVSPGTKCLKEATSVSQPVENITIPDSMGAAAYEFMGLVPAMAKLVWNAAPDKADSHKFSIPDWGLMHVEDSDDIEDWDEYYLHAGINQELTDAILDPYCAGLRGTASAKFWLKEVFRARYEFLAELGERARVALARLHGREMKPENDSVDDPNDLTIASLPYTASSLSASRDMPGYKVLWRAGYKPKTLSLVSNSSGQLSSRNIASRGDFGRRKAVYLTPDRNVADAYAAFYKVMSPCCDVVVARILVPEDGLAKLKTARQCPGLSKQDRQDSQQQEQQPQRDWRELIRAVRSRQQPPDEYRRHDVLIGPLLSARSTYPPDLDWHDVCLGDRSTMLWSIQYCFFSPDALALLHALPAGCATFFNVGARALPRDCRDVVVDRSGGVVVAVRGTQLGADAFRTAQFKGICGAWKFR